MKAASRIVEVFNVRGYIGFRERGSRRAETVKFMCRRRELDHKDKHQPRIIEMNEFHPSFQMLTKHIILLLVFSECDKCNSVSARQERLELKLNLS